MKLPTYFAEPQVQTLQQIIEDIQLGGLLLPQFQRPFVWTDEQRLLLLQSVRDGLPIGSILVWRTTKHKLEASTLVAKSFVAAERIAGPPYQYLLDGHQRLTTLIGALAPRRAPTEASQSLMADDLNTGPNWDIHFDLVGERFLFRRGSSTPATWIPTNIFLDSAALLRFQREMIRQGVEEDIINAADRVALAMRNYKIPVVPIVSNDLPNVTEAFQRVNSGGTIMSDTDIVMALSYGRSFDLRAAIEDASVKLRQVGWSSLEDKYLLAVVRLRSGLEVAKPDAKATSDVISERPEIIQEATTAIIAAAKFLRRHCGIAGPNAVPYSYQSVILANGLWNSSEPSTQTTHELCRWFWATAYSAYFLGARDREISEAADVVSHIIKGSRPYTANKRLNIEPLPARYDFRAARCKAFVARLAELHPYDSFGKTFDAALAVAQHGPDALTQLFPRRGGRGELYSSPENRFLLPPEDAPFLFGRLVNEELLRVDEEWLRRQGVSMQALDALGEGDHGSFLRLRRLRIEQLEADFLTSMKLPLPTPVKDL